MSPNQLYLLPSGMVSVQPLAVSAAEELASVIVLKDVSKHYGSVAVLDHLSMNVAAGAYLALGGASGAGKTTLLGILGLLEPPTSGEYFFRGVSTRRLDDRKLAELRNKSFGFVFQQFSLIPSLSAWQNVARPLTFASVPRREHRPRALELLDWLGLSDRAEHRPAQLSGGEQQRVAIARALVTDPQVILADEPTGNLPAEQWDPILDTFDLLHAAGKTIILVTHNPDVAARANSVTWLRAGKFERDTESQSRLSVTTRNANYISASSSNSSLEDTPAQLEFLGAARIQSGDQAVKIQPRLADILAMLVANPQGLTGEQLLLLVYGEGGRPGTLKSALSKLRRLVPISSQPYRLESILGADFVQLENALRVGAVREAVSLYTGSLLPQSEAPGVVELRERLDGAVRGAVLASSDGELVWQLAELLGDDLEVWEAAVAQLPGADHRRALARVRTERLREQWQ